MPVELPASLLSDPAFIPLLEPRAPAQATAHVECAPSTSPAPCQPPLAELPPQPAEPPPQSNGHDTEEAATTASVPFMIPQRQEGPAARQRLQRGRAPADDTEAGDSKPIRDYIPRAKPDDSGSR